MYETATLIEKVILIAVESKDSGLSADESLDELALLSYTSGAEVCGRLIQRRETADRAHYFGSGKLEELKDLITVSGATGIIADDELTSAQMRNMEKTLDTKIMDRTMLILDIFAGRATTAEGKVQVELAQQKYRLSHLTGLELGRQLSRLGGGIGTRGPGEKKLETDRRHIRDRISELSNQLKEIVTNRNIMRDRREKNNIPVISMVGYTNAGKSTLLNTLTGAGVLAEDKLFATLNTTTRRLTLPGGSEVLLSDTVGFIQKLPHQLIQAFRSTLEELNHADILMHIIDASNPRRDEQIKVVHDTLRELGCTNKPIISVLNKIDATVDLPLPSNSSAAASIGISALTGQNTDKLLFKTEEVLQNFRNVIKVIIPYNDGAFLNIIHNNCQIISEEHLENGTLIEAYGDKETAGRLQKYSYQA